MHDLLLLYCYCKNLLGSPANNIYVKCRKPIDCIKIGANKKWKWKWNGNFYIDLLSGQNYIYSERNVMVYFQPGE